MIQCGMKQAEIRSVIMQYKYPKKNIVHFVGCVVNWLSTMHGTNKIRYLVSFKVDHEHIWTLRRQCYLWIRSLYHCCCV